LLSSVPTVRFPLNSDRPPSPPTSHLPSILLIDQHGPVPRLARHEVLDGLVRLGHAVLLGPRLDLVLRGDVEDFGSGRGLSRTGGGCLG